MNKSRWLSLFLGTILLFSLALPSPQWSPLSLSKAEAKSNGYRFLELFYVRKVVFLVHKNYVERAQVKPKKMFVSGVKKIQLLIPSIMVHFSKDETKVTIDVNKNSKTFKLKPFRVIMDVPYQLSPIFQFIKKNYKGETKLRKIEFATIHGILKTLDPHTSFLPPSYYKEMQIHTGGKFGGLGIVIQNRDGFLTVVSPMPGTPASQVGLKPMDRIVRIGDESTINMSLNDAVSKLRGRAGTKAIIWVMRKGYTQPKKFVITRAIINVESVTHHLLPKKIGYIRIKNFQQDTSKDVRKALWKMYKKTKGLRGLVLDLRDNPGGLLSQAIEISDTFLSKGVIVTHAGGSSSRKEHRAQSPQTEPKYPIVVLMNRGSASASEIVAGALKNNQRAIVLGQRSYGKGTVQVLYPLSSNWPLFSRERCALKLTIAQYLTPGDISIQKIGITPDITLRRAHIEKDLIQFFDADTNRKKKKKKLPKYLKGVREGRSTLLNLPYFDTATKKEILKRQQEKYVKTKLYVDFEIGLARDLILKTKHWQRPKFFASVKTKLLAIQKSQKQKIYRALKKLKVNWSASSKKVSEPKVTVSYKLFLLKDEKGKKDKKGKKGKEDKKKLALTPTKSIMAGNSFQIRVTIKNNGKQTLNRLRAITRSQYWFLNRKEFVFGRLLPGKSKSWSVKVKLPKWLKPQVNALKLEVEAANPKQKTILKTEILLHCTGYKRPRFAFSYSVEERKGNNDQLIQAGEEVSLRVSVKNLGPGIASKVIALLKNKTGRELFIEKGRLRLGALKPGETVTGWFHFKIPPFTSRKRLEMQINLFDAELLTSIREHIFLRIYPRELGLKPLKLKNHYIKVREQWPWVYSGASLDAPRVARLAKGSIWRVTGKLGPFYQVVFFEKALGVKKFDKKRPKQKYKFVGWIPARDVTSVTSKQQSKSGLKFYWQYVTPSIKLTLAKQPLLLNKASFQLKGMITNNVPLRDVYILVNGEKVFFKSLRNIPKLTLNVPVKLKKGRNRILIVARETIDFSGFKELLIFYKPK